MTPVRQRRKTDISLDIIFWGLAVFLTGSSLVLPSRTHAAVTEQVVTDKQTGLAIGGYDPVAYFSNGAPALGVPEIEYQYAGAAWRFRNQGNRAAFAEDPEVYMPSFGGYDPVALVRGVALPGNPLVWFIVGNSLYLFFNLEARDAFAADVKTVIAAAEAKWPEVASTLISR
jgi:hypothetical protein